MSRIGGRHTRPELAVRKALHRRGFRFALHRKDLPGKPDLVLPALDTVIFVHGCFWHRHDCDYFRLPKSNCEFWQQKLNGNFSRDARNLASLSGDGWYVGIIWECAIRGQMPEHFAERIDRLAAWLKRTNYRRRSFSIDGQSRNRRAARPGSKRAAL